ncbi:Dimodular nonribosomal peptide synthase [Pseudoalteromonas holothuriae]|uniref:Dimodular nonribosomal peptide synthase n=1 Tax=Pseudoalteromonas holothuriae TaxID=2963714 RepID=A0ABM9GGV2_9GAMM|nr:amino acid adenylation domain-containing protein [Pseudoalteromonas sp. CIP111951]CAH9056699.1 Dimodular nonribosomal peptide synthase [Pseudoalteromonas sp. CIP111951]
MKQLKGDFDSIASLFTRFARHVELQPNNVAVSDEHTTLTYSELAQRATLKANNLRLRGVKPGDNVGILLNRSVQQVVSVIAILQLGACYVPIDPDYPSERVNWILDTAQPSAIITTQDIATRFALYDMGHDKRHLHLVSAEHIDTELQLQSDVSIEPVRPNCPAYIIFTSGSTGKPKGVAVGHEQVLALLDSALAKMDARAGDVWTLFHSLAFDFSVWELWGALSTGARLEIVPKSIAWSASAFSDFLIDKGITILNQTPSAFYGLIDVQGSLDNTAEPLPLRYVIFGGEALNLDRLKSWWAKYPKGQPELVNMYGITETTVHVTWLTLHENMDALRSPIGVALGSLEVILLNDNLEQVQEGEVGEIYVAGEQLAYGYLGRADLTATRFVASPFHHGKRLYRSGDLAMRQGSNLYYFGRADRQLKIRGFRIEPAEIEAVLISHKCVADAFVIPTPANKNGLVEGLLAVLTTKETDISSQALKAQLKSHIAEQLPAHYLPTDFLFVSELPLTINGKLDIALLHKKWLSTQNMHGTKLQQRMQLLNARKQQLNNADV